MKPLVSVLMCFRNEDSVLLKTAIDSILNQNYSNLELILVDDASNQDYEFLKKYRSQFPKIKYIKNDTNIGLTKSLNRGLSIVNGKYVARLDSDDVSFSDRIDVQVQFLESQEDYVIVGSRFLITEKDKDSEPADSKELEFEEICKMISSQNFTAHSTILIRTDKLRDLMGYNEFYYYAQDYDLYLRMLRLGKIKVLNKILVRRNIFDSAISYRKRKQQRFYAVIIMIRAFLKYGGGVAFFKNIVKALFVITMPSQITTYIKSLSYFNFRR